MNFRYNGTHETRDGIETFIFPNIRSMMDFIGKLTQKTTTLDEWTELAWPIKMLIDDEEQISYWFEIDRPTRRIGGGE